MEAGTYTHQAISLSKLLFFIKEREVTDGIILQICDILFFKAAHSVAAY